MVTHRLWYGLHAVMGDKARWAVSLATMDPSLVKSMHCMPVLYRRSVEDCHPPTGLGVLVLWQMQDLTFLRVTLLKVTGLVGVLGRV